MANYTSRNSDNKGSKYFHAVHLLLQCLEHEVIKDVADRIRETMAYLRTAEIEAQQLYELGFSPTRIRKEAMKLLCADQEYRKAVAKNTLDHKKTVRRLLQGIISTVGKIDKKLLKEAADLSYLDDLRVWKQAGKAAVRTGVHQISARIMDANIQNTGENLVYVSKHWGARNIGTGHANHEQWQGRVYFIKDGTDYSEEAYRIGQDRIMSLWYATGYSADGAKHWG